MVVTKGQYQGVLKKLGFTKAGKGKREIQYEKMLNGKIVATTALSKGRGDIPIGTMVNIIKHQLLIGKKDYSEYQGCTKSKEEYEAHLLNCT